MTLNQLAAIGRDEAVMRFLLRCIVRSNFDENLIGVMIREDSDGGVLEYLQEGTRTHDGMDKDVLPVIHRAVYGNTDTQALLKQLGGLNIFYHLFEVTHSTLLALLLYKSCVYLSFHPKPI